MAPQAVFFQACPVCGRSLRMPVQCFGREVTCVHCGGEFQASERSGPPLASLDLAPPPPTEAVGMAGLPHSRVLFAAAPASRVR